MSVSVWDKIDLSVVDASTEDEVDASTEDEPEPSPTAPSKRSSWRRVFLAGDILGALLWVLGITKLLFFDYDRYIADKSGSPWDTLADFRSLVLLAVIAAILSLHKRAFLVVIYVAIFPLVVIFWKIPKLLIAIRSWNLVLALATIVSSSSKHFRLRLLIRVVEIIVIAVALTSTTSWLSIACALVLTCALLYHYVQALVAGAKASKFVQYQQKTIANINQTAKFDPLRIDPELKSDEVEVFSKGQLERFVNSVSTGLLAVKLMAFYASLLQQYRRSLSVLLLNALSFIWLFLQSITILAVVNYSTYVAGPDQYKVDGATSFLSFLYYSTVSLANGTIPQIAAVGNAAMLIAICSAIYGTLLVFAVLAQVFMSFRQAKTDEDLNALVAMVDSKKVELSKRLESEYEVTLDDARRRLRDLGLGADAFIGYLASKVPDDIPD